VLRERVRCTRCGRRGADLQHASWGNSMIGYAPFPVDEGRAIVAANPDR
jgi:hypothetical protein